jgi:hypothetical protein
VAGLDKELNDQIAKAIFSGSSIVSLPPAMEYRISAFFACPHERSGEGAGRTGIPWCQAVGVFGCGQGSTYREFPEAFHSPRKHLNSRSEDHHLVDEATAAPACSGLHDPRRTAKHSVLTHWPKFGVLVH